MVKTGTKTTKFEEKSKKRKSKKVEDTFEFNFEEDDIEDDDDDVPRKKSKKSTSNKQTNKTSKNNKKTKSEQSENESSENEALGELPKLNREQLLAMNADENLPAVETIRGKKKQNHEKNVKAIATINIKKEIQKNEEYLMKWKNSRSEWKFEKLRQISIQQSALDDSKISDELWPISLEYLSGAKGSAKTVIIQLAEKQINEIDDEVEKTGDNSLVDHKKYKRARELLQMLA